MRQVDGTEALERVRKLRREMTPAEKHLWLALRGRRNEVLTDLEGVLTAIRAELLTRMPSPPHQAARDGSPPLPERERAS